MRFLFTLLLLTGCGAVENHEPKDSSPSDELRVTYDINLTIYNATTHARGGWPSDADCDATLWAGLACAGGANVEMAQAEYPDGVINRRPRVACWNPVDGDVGSKSTGSNDMQLGNLACQWATRGLAPLTRLAAYGESHDWVMGSPIDQLGDVILKPNQIGMLGRALYALSGGQDDRYYRRLFRLYPPVEKDYERHLQAIGIITQGEITEALRTGNLDTTLDAGSGLTMLDIDGNMLERLQALVAAEPENPLFQAALGTFSGDMSKAVELLLNGHVTRPTYVRSKDGLADHDYWRAEWLYAAKIVLKRMEK